MSEIIARRAFTPLYIWLDLAFLAVLIFLMLKHKRYMPVIVGFVMGIVYMIVDYGIFHLAYGTRSISEGHSLFWVLLWMSMSYGFTNFSWIYMWLDQDSHLFEWSLLIITWWFCCPQISQTFSGDQAEIIIQRTTGAYHGGMAIFLFVSYAGAIIYNLRQSDRLTMINIPRLLLIGIAVQFAWEAALLSGGIRSAGFSAGEKIITMIINSLLETNLGMPMSFVLYLLIDRRHATDFTRAEKKLGFKDKLRDYNSKHPFKRLRVSA